MQIFVPNVVVNFRDRTVVAVICAGRPSAKSGTKSVAFTCSVAFGEKD